jgi:hypothetical protein
MIFMKNHEKKQNEGIDEHVDTSVVPKMVAHPQGNDDDYEDESEPMEIHENENVSEDEHTNTLL